MTGYLYPYQYWYNISRVGNVFNMLKLAHTHKAEGTESYSIFDPGYNINNTAIAHFSWNLADINRENAYDDFFKKYSQKTFTRENPQKLSAYDY